jgi:Concanavalin A-like lectin/glucanases superfamily/PEP-CTERM motif
MKKHILSLLVAVGLIGSASAAIDNYTFGNGDLANGLVSFYSFNGNYNDSVGGNDLKQTADTSFSIGRFGNIDGAITFNSTTAYAQSMNPIGITGNADRSVSFWVYDQNALSIGNYSQTDIYSWGNVAPDAYHNAFSMSLRANDGGQIYAGGNYSDYVVSNLGDPFENQWNQITYVYSGSVSTTHIYLNGTLLSNNITYNDTTLNTPNNPLRVGDRGDGRGLEIPGTSISDLAIWNTALSSSQVSQLYTLQSAPEPSTYALFGLGAVGLLMVLRRKKTA